MEQFRIIGFSDDLKVARVTSAGVWTTLLMDRPNGGVDFNVYPQFRKVYRRAVKMRLAEMAKMGVARCD